jgi:hypothetical protein
MIGSSCSFVGGTVVLGFSSEVGGSGCWSIAVVDVVSSVDTVAVNCSSMGAAVGVRAVVVVDGSAVTVTSSD